MYNIGLLKSYFKIQNGTILLYFHNFLVTETVPVEPQRYNFRHKRKVIIPIPPRKYQKRNTKYQLDSWYYQQKAAFYNELWFTAYTIIVIHLQITLDNTS